MHYIEDQNIVSEMRTIINTPLNSTLQDYHADVSQYRNIVKDHIQKYLNTLKNSEKYQHNDQIYKKLSLFEKSNNILKLKNTRNTSKIWDKVIRLFENIRRILQIDKAPNQETHNWYNADSNLHLDKANEYVDTVSNSLKNYRMSNFKFKSILLRLDALSKELHNDLTNVSSLKDIRKNYQMHVDSISKLKSLFRACEKAKSIHDLSNISSSSINTVKHVLNSIVKQSDKYNHKTNRMEEQSINHNNFVKTTNNLSEKVVVGQFTNKEVQKDKINLSTSYLENR